MAALANTIKNHKSQVILVGAFAVLMIIGIAFS